MYRKPVGELCESFITSSHFPAELLILVVALKRVFRYSASKDLSCIPSLVNWIFFCYYLWYLGCKTWKLAWTSIIFFKKATQKLFVITSLLDKRENCWAKVILGETSVLSVDEKLVFTLTFTSATDSGMGGMLVTSLHASFALEWYTDKPDRLFSLL